MASSFTDATGHDLTPLCPWQNLYLKPLAKIGIVVMLPKVTTPGQSVSNWDLMERLKKALFPIQLDPIKVRESSLEVVIFDAELQTRSLMKKAIKILGNLTMKVPGFSKPLTVKASEAKSEFPSRHDWDLFYMHNKLDENQPGERPDTIYLEKIPVKWFNDAIVEGPSEIDFKKAMEVYGHVRMVDIPCLDPVRKFINPKLSGIKQRGFGFGQDVFFEAYVQYAEYKGFATAMDALRNMKWVKKIDGRYFQASVKVTFDTTRHLSNAMILRRDEERNRIIAEQRSNVEKEQRDKEDEERRRVEEHQRRREKEHKAREKKEIKREKSRKEEQERITAEKDAERQARARRIIESQRLVEYIFESIQTKEDRRIKAEEAKFVESLREAEDVDEDANKEEMLRAALLKQRELRMRERLKEKLSKGSHSHVDLDSELPKVNPSNGADCTSANVFDVLDKVQNAPNSSSTSPSNAYDDQRKRQRSPSSTSLSSTFEKLNETLGKKRTAAKKKKKKHQSKRHSSSSSSSSSGESDHKRKRTRSSY